jgi:predicted DsbA family dithiol-disulfide isomerase
MNTTPDRQLKEKIIEAIKKQGLWRKKIEEILREKGYDEKVFQTALETGKGKKRVEEDILAGNKIGVRGTPSIVVNGDLSGAR